MKKVMNRIMSSRSLSTAAFVAFTVAGVWATSSAFAEVPYSSERAEVRPGLQAAYQSYGQMKSDLGKHLLDRVAKRGLDIMVAEGCDRLREVGEVTLASQFEQEWKQQISLSLETQLSIESDGNLSGLELGDFDPISPWLDNFYNTLYKKTRGAVKGMRIIHDVYLMNYALAVALKPNGSWRAHTDYDRIEYRKHFIPFANTATYWVAYEACKNHVKKFKNMCDRAAGMLERAMGRYIAPKISDEVFLIATHHGHHDGNGDMISSDGLDYPTFEDQAFDPSEMQADLTEMSEE